MRTKYDWSEIPPEVQFMATDFDGWAFGYKSEPERLATEFSGDLFYGVAVLPYNNIYEGDWKDSLEQRPLEKN
ncbi:TPA: hypothetical protein ACGGC0_003729 [Acinetobacter baumannii]